MLSGKIKKGVFLHQEIIGYFHDWYYGMYDPKNNIKFVNYLKNDLGNISTELLTKSEGELTRVLVEDFSEIVNRHGMLTVCGVPRSKKESSYPYAKMGLKRAIRAAVQNTMNMVDGMDYIVRHTDTICTHRARWGYGGLGERPRQGLLRDTCFLSSAIAGKDILLVDDIYTPSVGIDEDAIQAVLDCGARSVIFYAVGYTARSNNNYRFCA